MRYEMHGCACCSQARLIDRGTKMLGRLYIFALLVAILSTLLYPTSQLSTLPYSTLKSTQDCAEEE